MVEDSNITNDPSTTRPLDAEGLTTPEPLRETIYAYLPPVEELQRTPTPEDLEERERMLKARPGDRWALVYYPPQGKLIIVPSDHPLNKIRISSNMAVYGSGIMETLTFEPDVTGNGGNIVLLEDRMTRLYDRSLQQRGVNFPVDRSTLAQGITDLMAVLGPDVLVEPDGNTKIGSIRVTVGPGMGKFGKRAAGQIPYADVEAYRTNKDFGDEARDGRGIVVAAGPDRRTTPFVGKTADNYGGAVPISDRAASVGAKDALIFAEYAAHNLSNTPLLDRIEDPRELEEAMLDMAISDGLGAETMAIRLEADGTQTLLLPPNDGPLAVKRLGGVTADYVIDHMAPKMGIKTSVETSWSLRDILEGRIIGMFYAGNAARLAEITRIIMHTKDGQVLREIQLPEVPEIEQALVDRFEAEVAGQITPSDESLLTHVSFDGREEVLAVLEKAYANWLNPPSERGRKSTRRGDR